MLGDGTIRGIGLHSAQPEWRPLVDLIRNQLTELYMWIFDLSLSDGA